MSSYLAEDHLLTPPTKRAAFSDRTAYLMAEMSRLAYFKFEGGNVIGEIKEIIGEYVPQGEAQVDLLAKIRNRLSPDSSDHARAILRDILDAKGYELIETFNSGETGAQAFLCFQPEQKIAILAFRGTEKSLKDIRADIAADLYNAQANGRSALMHRGYFEQYDSIRVEIEEVIQRNHLKDIQLFITGHSLGGALAITATKFMANDITGACYTFGSPPVGMKDFAEDIKTPIYRIVNHVDIVPRLPNPIMVYGVRVLGIVIEGLATPFSRVFEKLEDTAWYSKFKKTMIDSAKYRQSGYGSFLVGDGNDVHLRYSVGVYDRLLWWFRQIGNLFKGDFALIADHSITKYSGKLAVWANRRV